MTFLFDADVVRVGFERDLRPVHPAEAFSVALDAFYHAAGAPSAAMMCKRGADRHPAVRFTRSQLHEWRHGEHLPNDLEKVDFLVEFLTGNQPEEGEKREWRALWAASRAAAKRPGRKGGRMRTVRPADRTIAAWQPSGLGVQPAVSTLGMPELTRYVSRPHDGALDIALADDTRSVLVVLVGDSATGKTRALYEAVCRSRCLRRLPVYFPRTSAELLGRLAGPELRDPALLWLDDLHNLLLDGRGEEAAAALHTRLTEPGGARLVALAAEWPTEWDRWTDPADEDYYGRPQVQRLLTRGAQRISVPEEFDKAEIEALRCDPQADPRLVAAAHAGGRILQEVTGGPALVARYEDDQRATPGKLERRLATALLTAAMDLSRIGYHENLRAELLFAAASGFLGRADAADTDDGTWRRALAVATTRRSGVAALNRDDNPADTTRYDGLRLHRYLEQHGVRTRHRELAPASVWQAVADHVVSPDVALAMAQQAESRMLYTHAELLYERAARSVHTSADQARLRLWAAQGRLADLEELAAGGDLNAHRALAAVVGTVDVLWSAVNAGCTDLANNLGDALRQAGNLDGAAEAYRAAIAAGHEYARRGLVEVLLDDGQTEAAIDAGREGGSVPGWVLRDLFAHGHAKPACRLLSEMLDRGDHSSVIDPHGVVNDLEAAGRPDLIERLAATGLPPARDWVNRHRVAASGDLDPLVEEGVPGAREERATRLRAAADEAKLRALAAEGDRPARRQLAELLIAQGQPEEGARLLRDLLRGGDGLRLDATFDIGPRLVGVLAELDDEEALRELTDEAVGGVQRPLADYWFDREDVDQLRRLAVVPDGYLRRRLVMLLERQGRYEEMEEMAMHSNAAYKAASQRRVAEANFAELLKLVVRGEPDAKRAARRLIETQPERADLRNLARYGLKPDGTIATS